MPVKSYFFLKQIHSPPGGTSATIDEKISAVEELRSDFSQISQKASTMAYRYRFFRLPFAGKIKNGISAGPKVVSKIPYTLQEDFFGKVEISRLHILRYWIILK